MLEASYATAQAIIYVATTPKSNAAHNVWGAVKSGLPAPEEHPQRPHEADEGRVYRAGYTYDFEVEGSFSGQNFRPGSMPPQTFYEPTLRGYEP